MKPPFSQLTGHAPRQKVVDVGAYQISGDPIYWPLLKDSESELVGFEPNPVALANLKSDPNRRGIFLPNAIGDGRRRTLHICAATDMSSLYAPDPAILKLFHGFSTWGQVTEMREIDTSRLDDLSETEGMTFLQMDIQGAELLALQNAQNRLRGTLALHLEVEFLPLYFEQPLFSDVEQFLRHCGFVFHKFSTPTSRVIQPLLVGGDIMAGLSQLVWADAVFVRDFSRLELLDDNQIFGLAAIMHDCYSSWDLTLHLLTELDRRTQTSLAMAYMTMLTNA